jgi:16S rRNA G966 N2-methylase RsmD
VFLDPPFDSGLLETAAHTGASLLEPNGRLYLEYRRSRGAPTLAGGWKIMKSSRAGQVGFALAGRM